MNDWRDGLLFVPCYWSSSVEVLSASSLTLHGYIPLPSAPTGLVYASGTDELFASSSIGLVVISPTSLDVVRTINDLTLPNFGYDPVDQDLYLVGYGGNNVSLLSTQTFQVVGEVPVGLNPVAATWDPVDQEMFISNSGSANVTAISSTTHHVVGNVAVGTDPYVAAWDTATGLLYVSNLGSGNISAVDTGSMTGIASFPLSGLPSAMLADPSDGDLYYVDYSSSNLSYFYPSAGAVPSVVPVGLDPWGMTNLSSPNDLLIANELSNSLTDFDPSSQSVLVTVPVGEDPTAVAYDPAVGDLYIAESGEDWVTVVSATSGQELVDVQVGEFPDGIVADAAQGKVFVANGGSDTVSVLSSTTNQVVGTVNVGREPAGLALVPADNWLFVANSDGNNLTLISTVTDQVVGSYAAGPDPGAVALSPNGSYLYVADEGGSTVSVLSLSSLHVVHTIPVGSSPIALVVDPYQALLYVANYGSSNVSVVNATSWAPVGSLATASLPFSLALDPGDWEVFVASAGSSEVEVYDELSGALLSTVAVGDFPDGLAYDPASATMFVVNYASGTLTTFSGSTYPDTVQLSTLRCAATLTWNGVPVANASSLTLGSGSYDVQANCAGGAKFADWTTTGGVTATSPGTTFSPIQVQGNGSATAHWNIETTFVLVISPTFCGPVEVVTSGDYGNGSTISVEENEPFYALASTCSGYDFAGWGGVGAVTIASPTALQTEVTVTGPGATLVASYVPSVATLDLEIPDADCGTVSVAGTTYSASAQLSLLVNEDYALLAEPCPGWAFVAWEATSGAYVSSTYDSDTSVVLVGNATLTAVIAPYITVSYHPDFCTVYLNDSALEAGSEAIELGVYSLSLGTCVGYDFQEWNATGAVTVYDRYASSTQVAINGGGSLSAWSSISSTDTPMEVDLSANPTTGTAPLTDELTATIYGGDAPFLLQWTFGDGTQEDLSGQGSISSVSHTFSSANTYLVVLTVHDSQAETSSAEIQVSVSSPPPTRSISGSADQGLEVGAGVLVALVAAGVAWVVLLRRRRPPELDLVPGAFAPPPPGPSSPPVRTFSP